ncbi:MAG: hypothetical protein PWQ55_340 [Chloroflexota bacterium]|nr:hypothetical protein [Chloroflexota bacterium]
MKMQIFPYRVWEYLMKKVKQEKKWLKKMTVR